MLDEKDKKWIIGATQSLLEVVLPPLIRATVQPMLDIAFAEQSKIIHKKIQEEIDELARMVARGFDRCATKEELWAVENRLGGVENGLGSLESRLIHIENTMVTKDYLDDRLGIVKAKDFEIHKQLKMNSVMIVEELARKRIIGPKRANTILAMHPFPQKMSEA